MIVFKNYFKILKKHKGIILLYIGILLMFTLFSQQSTSTNNNFSVTKPNVTVINLDNNSNITDNFYKYMKKNTKIISVKNSEVDDALFYQKIDAAIYIYKGYTNDFLNNKEKNLKVKYGNSASSSYVKMLLERYFKVADITNNNINSENTIIENINLSLKNNTKVEVKNTLDIDKMSRASYFFDYANYSILAICIYVTALILIIFNDKKLKDRNNISSKKSSNITKELYLGNLCFILFIWIFIVLLSVYINGNIMFTKNGIFLILNSLIFMICALSIGFLVGNLFKSENAVSAVVNIVALGTSFTCGSFIPIQYLPDTVVKFSKVLPSYWFIHNNNLIATIEKFDSKVLIDLFTNMGIVLIFAGFFFFLAVLYNRKKRVN